MWTFSVGSSLRHGLPHAEASPRSSPSLQVTYNSKLQALVYDILPSLEEGARKRCSERGATANSKHWLKTSFLPWRKVPESDARSVMQRQTPGTGLHPSFLSWRKVPDSDTRSVVQQLSALAVLAFV